MAAETIYYRFVLKRDTAANFTSASTLLLAGEMGIETDTKRWKLGDGVTAWPALAYQDSVLKLENFTGDVDTAARADGFALVWDAGAGKHIYAAAGGGGGGGGGGGPYEFVSEVIVTTAQQDIDFSGLDLDADCEFLLKVYALSSSTTTHYIRMLYNGDTTDANYQRQALLSNGTAVTAGRASDAYILYTQGAIGSINDVIAGDIRIRKAAGLKPLASCIGNAYAASSSNLDTFSAVHIRNNTANVTSIKLRHSVNFGVGTRVRLYKLTKAVPSDVGKQIGYARTVSTTTATTTASIPSDNTTPQNTEGAAYASLDTTITPKAASSLLEIEVDLGFVSASALTNITLALFRDSDANAIATSITQVSGADVPGMTRVKVVVAATVATATTFKLRWGVSGGVTGYILSRPAGNLFNSTAAATMTIKEIGQ